LKQQFKDVIVVAVHPGVVQTSLYRFTPWYLRIGMFLFTPWLKSAKQGAQTSLFAATNSAVESGGYYVDCKPLPSSLSSYDKELQQRLWNVSCGFVGLTTTTSTSQ